jgi:hypothetical protein
VESDLIVKYLIILFNPIVFVFFYGRKAKCMELMVFDARRQGREGGMQVLQQCYFIPQG